MATRAEREQSNATKELQKVLKEMMMRPDNRKCADCRKRDPRWASWNLGIFVCIRCSGVHRSLGTHISKVKSADLDTWTAEQVDNMRRWGNGKANLYWEHDWPRDMEPPENNIEQFIRAKYERKQYSMKGGIPDPESLGAGSVTPAATPVSSNAPTQGNLISTAPVPKSETILKQPLSSSQQLFDAFQSPPVSSTSSVPPQQQQTAFKNSILSLYNTPSQPVRPLHAMPPQQAVQPVFADFGTFSAAPLVNPVAVQPQASAFVSFANFSSGSVTSSQTQQPPVFANFSNQLISPPPSTTVPSQAFPSATPATPQQQVSLNAFGITPAPVISPPQAQPMSFANFGGVATTEPAKQPTIPSSNSAFTSFASFSQPTTVSAPHQEYQSSVFAGLQGPAVPSQQNTTYLSFGNAPSIPSSPPVAAAKTFSPPPVLPSGFGSLSPNPAAMAGSAISGTTNTLPSSANPNTKSPNIFQGQGGNKSNTSFESTMGSFSHSNPWDNNAAESGANAGDSSDFAPFQSSTASVTTSKVPEAPTAIPDFGVAAISATPIQSFPKMDDDWSAFQ